MFFTRQVLSYLLFETPCKAFSIVSSQHKKSKYNNIEFVCAAYVVTKYEVKPIIFTNNFQVTDIACAAVSKHLIANWKFIYKIMWNESRFTYILIYKSVLDTFFWHKTFLMIIIINRHTNKKLSYFHIPPTHNIRNYWSFVSLHIIYIISHC